MEYRTRTASRMLRRSQEFMACAEIRHPRAPSARRKSQTRCTSSLLHESSDASWPTANMVTSSASSRLECARSFWHMGSSEESAIQGKRPQQRSHRTTPGKASRASSLLWYESQRSTSKAIFARLISWTFRRLLAVSLFWPMDELSWLICHIGEDLDDSKDCSRMARQWTSFRKDNRERRRDIRLLLGALGAKEEALGDIVPGSVAAADVAWELRGPSSELPTPSGGQILEKTSSPALFLPLPTSEGLRLRDSRRGLPLAPGLSPLAGKALWIELESCDWSMAEAEEMLLEQSPSFSTSLMAMALSRSLMLVLLDMLLC
mmetsp:Transcript_18978/g.60234  ORF Transcript_18978/g.60234 Transcript_18978/m.60234 type:complete len:319 (+) Transcript_18978:885-1841(+)